MFIFLIGMPGSGKTHWLEPLADALRFRFVDLDTNLEKSSGMRIREIFDRYGEAYFRDLERAALDAVMQQKKDDWVVATGGGTPCFFDNLQKMKASGLVVYLKRDMDELTSHLSGAASLRPLLHKSQEENRSRLKTLFTHRKDIYEQADVIVDAHQLTLPIFVARLIPFLNH